MSDKQLLKSSQNLAISRLYSSLTRGGGSIKLETRAHSYPLPEDLDPNEREDVIIIYLLEEREPIILHESPLDSSWFS